MAHASGIELQELRIAAPGLSDSPLRVRVYLPPDYAGSQARYEVLYINDGQDMEAVGTVGTLASLDATHAITRVIVVAIDMPPDRMAGYGLFDRVTGEAVAAPTKYGEVGANAGRYAAWLTGVLVPTIDERYRTIADSRGRAIVGWSLGALSAFGIGWQYPELFGRVGAFSPSLWLSSERGDAHAIQATRIAHRLVDASEVSTRPALFFAAGTKEETDDRDGDGVIDVLDDTQDLIGGWTGPDGRVRKGIRQASATTDGGQAGLFVLEGGRHDQVSWSRMLPVFLRWAYAPALAANSR